MRKALLALALAVPANAVVGVSRPAAPGEHAGIVFVDACTGTLLTPRVVLTAAHCLFDYGVGGASTPKQKRFITVGTGVDLKKPGSRRDITVGVDDVRLHPGFHGRFRDPDLALLLLPAGKTDGLETYGLSRAAPREGAPGVIVGYGRTDPDGGLFGVKNVGAVRVGEVENDGLVMNLAGESSLCTGDSGGPVLSVDGKTLVGVMSFFAGRCAPGNGLAVRVDAARVWIESTAAAWGAALDARKASGVVGRLAEESGL